MHNAISEIVKFPTGKSVIQDIVSSIEPRLKYYNSLKSTLETIKSSRNSEVALRNIFGMFNFIDSEIVKTKAKLITYLNNDFFKLTELVNTDPRVIRSTYYTGILFVDYCDYTTIVDKICFFLDKFLVEIKNKVDNLRFKFGSNDNSYEHSRIISIKHSDPIKASVVTGPRLKTLGVTVGVVNRDVIFTDDERLFHEILHYTHLGLRQEYLQNDFFQLGLNLFRNHNFSPNYSTTLNALWTSPEEFRTITGFFINPNDDNLYYSLQNESSYLHDKGKSFRCSHALCYLTKTPWFFVNLMKNSPFYISGEDRDVDYNGQCDNFI